MLKCTGLSKMVEKLEVFGIIYWAYQGSITGSSGWISGEVFAIALDKGEHIDEFFFIVLNLVAVRERFWPSESGLRLDDVTRLFPFLGFWKPSGPAKNSKKITFTMTNTDCEEGCAFSQIMFKCVWTGNFCPPRIWEGVWYRSFMKRQGGTASILRKREEKLQELGPAIEANEMQP